MQHALTATKKISHWSTDPDIPTSAAGLWTPSCQYWVTHTHTHTDPFNGPFSGTTQVSQYRKGRTNLDFSEARQWVAVASAGPYTSLQLAPDNHASTPPLSFLQARCPSFHPTNSVKALKAYNIKINKACQNYYWLFIDAAHIVWARRCV